ncbi:hypothetical protein NPIL_411931 [Nephila pilipes]|uniref:Uncharacterized protein n=1 Tax=Nephila pilipes TaxID=299642 RepID=A0A8X6Q3H1_NEPPI|nr:hypothetical protein NPIL_411931 [Nephila pilipes]
MPKKDRLDNKDRKAFRNKFEKEKEENEDLAKIISERNIIIGEKEETLLNILKRLQSELTEVSRLSRKAKKLVQGELMKGRTNKTG